MNPTPLMLFLVVLVISSCQPRQIASESPANKTWLEHHWKRPLAPQGEKPAGVAHLGIELSPESCGGCHPTQFADWSTSLHSQAMGPGLVGQYLDAQDPTEIESCMECHSPLAEQTASSRSGLSKPGLHQKGLVCASCHVRKWQVKGPPALVQNKETKAPKPHGGFEPVTAFQSAYFCASCHQFAKDGYALEGKLLENTYAEWQASGYPEKKTTCQTCHMPGRRHLWRGIHDPEMVRQGLKIEWKGVELEQGQWVGKIKLTNQGAGHALPTYVTPLIEVVFVQLDTHKAPLPSTAQIAPIGRMVTPDIAQELYDTRLMPHESRGIQYRSSGRTTARWLSVKVVVKPDEFYRKLYIERLSDPGLIQGRAALQAALDTAIKREYTLWEQTYRLGR